MSRIDILFGEEETCLTGSRRKGPVSLQSATLCSATCWSPIGQSDPRPGDSTVDESHCIGKEKIGEHIKLYFVRHGESIANLLRKFSNSGIKHPLTEMGVAQARALAQKLAGIPFESIHSSPVLRAMQTAQIVAEQLHVPVEVTEALREWSVGIYEGTTDPEGWELHRKVQEDWYFHNKPGSRMPGGESFDEIRERFVPLIENLIQKHKNTDRNILCVAHGGLYTAMLPVIIENIDHAFVTEKGVAHTSPIIIEVRPAGLYCTTWCDTPMV